MSNSPFAENIFSTLSPVEMLHDSALYKCTTDIDSITDISMLTPTVSQSVRQFSLKMI